MPRTTSRAGVASTDAQSGPSPVEDASPDLRFGGLAGDIGFLIRRAQVWIFQDFIRTLSSCSIKPAQYSVLVMIDENPGLSQMALSKALNIERAHLMHMLDALEERGLVKREPSARDRRSHALHLTESGRGAMTNIRRLVAQHQQQVADRLGQDGVSKLLEALSSFR